MQSPDDETVRRDREEIAEILAKAVVRQLTCEPAATSFDNSPEIVNLGLSSSENHRSL
jgi:hypothetical protein